MGPLRHLRASGSPRPAPRLLAVAALAAAALLACGAGTAAAAGAAPSLYVANEGAGTVSAIDTGDGSVTSITVESLPQAVAISPDGAFAYVTNQGSGHVSVIDTAKKKLVGSPITVGKVTESLPTGIATSPDGSSLYVTYGYRPGTSVGRGEVAVISSSERQVTHRIPVGDEPTGIAVTPDGKRAFVADFGSGQVTEIAGLDGPSPEAKAPIDVGGTPSGVAVSADGSRVYVSNGNTNRVSVLDGVSGGLVGTLSDGFEAPQGIATSPAGGGAYVANFDGDGLAALGAGDQLLGTVAVGASPFGVVYSPDGKTVYASGSSPSGAGTITAVDAVLRTVVGDPVAVDDDPLGLAIEPDQAPHAALAATRRSAGLPTEFDAKESTVRYGKIVSYAWDFGDGKSETTTTPTTEHVYAKPGIYTASVTETDSAGTSTARVFTGQTVSRNGGPSATAARSLAITAPRPLASIAPTSLDFGEQVISQLYLSKPVRLSNDGDAPLAVKAVTLAGTGPRSFAVDDDHCSGQTLAPGAECLVEVLFLPTSTGAKAATLAFTDNAPGSPQQVTLSGVGQSPEIAVSPPRLAFPDQAPDSDSAPLTLTVSNGSTVPLQVEGVAIAGKDAGEFDISGQTCTAAPVEAGHSCAIEVEFRPASFGPGNALVEIEDDAPGSPHAAAVVGAGVGGRAAVSPVQLSFGAQAAGSRGPAQAVSVTNTGNAPLHVLRTVLAGSGAGGFALGDRCSGTAVAPGASCAIEVAFVPAAAGNYVAQLSLEDDAVGTPPSVALTGTGIAATVPGGGGQPPAGGGQRAGAGGPPPAVAPGRVARRPRARSGRARRIGPRRVRLRGRVDPNGEPTRYRFKWGRTRRYGRLTPRRSAGRGTRARRIGVTIRGLRPHTTYHYRLIAVNRAGTSRGRDRTFRTGG